MHRGRRTVVVATVVAAQLLCLTAGLAAYQAWLSDGIEVLVQQHGHVVLPQSPAADRDRMEASIQEFVAGNRNIMLVVAVLVVASSGLATFLLLRRYDRGLTATNADLEQKVEQRTREALTRRDAVIFGLAKLAESRDGQTGEHLDRVSAYVENLARCVAHRNGGTPDDQTIAAMRTTAALHDIGKVGIPDAVLTKPGPLTDDEREVMQRHVGIGGDTLWALKQRWGDDAFLTTAVQIAYGHHEKWDGTGYPFGLSGEQIPLAARIMAVADVYDALRSQRHYKAAMDHDQARQVIVQGAGTHFDPKVVEAFLNCEAAMRTIADGKRQEA